MSIGTKRRLIFQDLPWSLFRRFGTLDKRSHDTDSLRHIKARRRTRQCYRAQYGIRHGCNWNVCFPPFRAVITSDYLRQKSQSEQGSFQTSLHRCSRVTPKSLICWAMLITRVIARDPDSGCSSMPIGSYYVNHFGRNRVMRFYEVLRHHQTVQVAQLCNAVHIR